MRSLSIQEIVWAYFLTLILVDGSKGLQRLCRLVTCVKHGYPTETQDLSRSRCCDGCSQRVSSNFLNLFYIFHKNGPVGRINISFYIANINL